MSCVSTWDAIARESRNYIATGRDILLTVFRKTKRREAAEIDRAQRVMRVCISEGHAAEEVDER